MKSSGTVTNEDADTSDEAKRFAIYKSGDYYYIYSLKAGKFIQITGSALYQYATIPYVVSASNDNSYPLRISTWDLRNYANNNDGGSIVVNTYTTQDDGNRLSIAEVGDLTSAEVTAIENALAASPLLDMHKAFTVTANRGTWCANAAGTSLATTKTNTSPATGYDQFALMFFNDKLYLYNVGTKKFIKKDGSLMEGRGDEVSVRYSGDELRPYMFFFPDGPIYFNMQDGGGSYAMNSYSTADNGNKQSISVVNVDPYNDALAEYNSHVEVTYKILFNGNEIGREVAGALKGGTPSVSSSWTNRAFCSFSYDTETIPTEDCDINVTVNWTGPFKFSPSFSEAVWYYAKVRNTKYLRADETNKDSNGRYTTNTTNEQTDVYKWAFTGNPYAISIMNKGAGEGQYLYYEDTAPYMTTVTPANDSKARWIVAASGSGFSVRSETGNTLYINDNGMGGNLGIWNSDNGASDAGSCWLIEEIPVTITYNILYGDEVVATGSEEQLSYVAPAVPSSLQRDFVTFTYDVDTVTPSTTVNATATWNGPFELAADYASAHWYDMAIRGTWYVTSDQTDESGALLTVNANALGLGEDAYHWTFVGDPWHIQVYNKAQANNFGYTSQQDQGVPTFESDTYYWSVRRSTSDIANSFVLNVPGTALFINQYGGAGGSLKFWDSTNNISDAGSAFTVFDIPTNFAEYATTEIKPYVEATGYFAFTDAVKANIGWQDSYETNCPYDTYKTMKNVLMSNVDNISSYILPETGYYTLKNKNYSTYLGIDPSDANMYGNYASATAAKQIVKLTKTGTSTYTIRLMGKYAPATVAKSTAVTASTDAGSYTVSVPAIGYAAFQADTSNDYSCLHRNSEGSIVGWEANAYASQWEVEDAESILFEIGANGDGYATAYLPFPYTTPEGVTAYTGTNKSNNSLSLTAIEGTVPASTAVVIKGTAGSTPTFTIAAETEAIAGNALQGSYDPVSGGDGIYALAKKNDTVGFYPVASNVTIPVGKAFLNLGSSSVKAFTFVFNDDDATAIQTIDNGQKTTDGAIYKQGSTIVNVAGQRLQKMQKGINIVNGKKILK